MKKNEVGIGKVYIMKVSGKLTKVRLVSESPYGGWNGLNLETNREVRIRTAAKLRKEYSTNKPPYLIFDNYAPCSNCKMTRWTNRYGRCVTCQRELQDEMESAEAQAFGNY